MNWRKKGKRGGGDGDLLAAYPRRSGRRRVARRQRMWTDTMAG
jgi:hypothetical protein